MRYKIRVLTSGERNFVAVCSRLPGWFYPFDVDESREEVERGILDSIARFKFPELSGREWETGSFELRASAEELHQLSQRQQAEFRQMRTAEEA